MKKIIFLPQIFIGVIFISLSLCKIVKVLNSPHFTKDETCIFWTESALQYRYAKFIAMGNKIPEIDKKTEFPEGFLVKKYHSILMESVSGYLYRLIPNKIPFHLFLIILMGFYSSLPVIAVYLISSLLWNNKWIGVFSALLYSFTFSASMTVLNIAFEFQDFALAFIFFQFFFYLKAESIQDNKLESISYSTLSGVFLVTALASWGLTEFYFFVFLLYISFRVLCDKEYNVYLLYPISISAILAGLTLPNLNFLTFLLSIPMILNYCLIFTALSVKKRKWRFLYSIIVILTVKLLLTNRGFIPQTGFDVLFKRGILPLIIAKIKGFGTRPVAGGNLLWETLVLWVHPFNNPTISWTLRSFGFLLPASLFSSIYITKDLMNHKEAKKFILPLYFFFIFLISYLFFERIDVFLVIFLTVLSGYFVRRFKKKGVILLILLMIPNLLVLMNHKPMPPGPNRNYLLQVIYYIKNKTEPNAPVLSHFAYSPTILTWTGRPVIFHPKFESPGTADKTKRFEYLLFQTEEEFYKFCKKNKVRYFLLSADMLLSRNYSSIRYRTHNYKTSRETILFKLHFYPEKLKRFTLIYSNPHYRLYSVNYPDIQQRNYNFEYYRIYDKKNFNLRQLGIE